jgi:hypothetical protein
LAAGINLVGHYLFFPPLFKTTEVVVLAKELQNREEELDKNTKERIKIVEKGGLQIKDILG